MKLRWIIIPLCIILYIWWSYVAITNWTQLFLPCVEASFVNFISVIWIIITGIAVFSGSMFSIVLFIDYCEKHW